ncbi:MAG: pyruvoyl-dependent arginine decarboxylase, partial [Patescibacteria group bacterium]
LRDAGGEGANLVFVSSICPPDCAQVTPQQGIEELGIRDKYQGRVVYAVGSRIDILGTKTPELVSVVVALARPTDKTHHGYFVEYHGRKNALFMETIAIDYAKKMLESKKLIVKECGEVVAAAYTKPGEWLSVIALAVFID